MSPTTASTGPGICPRCRSTAIEARSTSPVSGVWTVFGCATCLYAWRSTEPEENKNPEHYPKVFRLKPEALADLPIVPLVPPLRRTSGRE